MVEFARIFDIIGNTPLVELDSLVKGVRILGKLEKVNPSGSIKDRSAAYILRGAFLRGELHAGDTVVEATSGNMGISLAMLGAAMGLKVRIVMPKNASRERSALIRAYGGEVVFTPAEGGMDAATKEAERIAKRTGAFYTRQFENRDGLLAHYETTGAEIYADLLGVPDILVAGVGTGGTLCGTAKYLKERGECVSVAVEPSESAILSGGKPSTHGIAGIGAGFVPRLVDRRYIDRVSRVSTAEAEFFAEAIPKRYGIGIGISAGAALAAAVKAAKEEASAGKLIAVILPDGRERYLSAAIDG